MSLCQPFVSSMTVMLRDSVVVAVRTRPRAIPLAMITMKKSTHGLPFVSHIWVAYGALLGGPPELRYEHERGWENSRQLCKPETKSTVCITVENSPNPSRVHIRLSKQRKKFSIAFIKYFSKLIRQMKGNSVH